MIYAKPEINVLGDASRIIQLTGGKDPNGIFEAAAPTWPLNPAYDLDE